MTLDRFRECRAAPRWSQRGLADALGVHPATARRWATGENTIPINVAQWLEDLAAVHQGRPVPMGWQKAAA